MLYKLNLMTISINGNILQDFSTTRLKKALTMEERGRRNL